MLFTTAQNKLATVTDISVGNGTLDSLITIKGSGFGSIGCENQVLINDIICSIISSTTTELQCKLDDNSGLEPNKVYQFGVLVKNFGYALQNGTFTVKFLAIVTSLSTEIGSVAGGTQLTISGRGFIPLKTSIQIGQTIYYNDGLNVNITYNSINLNTNSVFGFR